MAVTSPDLSISLTVTNGCGTIKLTDTTGEYPTADGGYGLPDGPTINDVDALTITVNMLATNISFVYAFTISSGTITAATLSLAGATPVNILSELASTDFPLEDFDLFGSYGVTLPALSDDVYTVEYQIEGTVTPDDFDFSVTGGAIVDCATACCIDKKFIDLDLDCSCSENPSKEANYLLALLNKARVNVSYNYFTEGSEALELAKSRCEGADCGC